MGRKVPGMTTLGDDGSVFGPNDFVRILLSEGATHMTKSVLISVGVFFAVMMLVVGLLLGPIIHDGFRSAGQKRALQARTDYPQIAAACVSLARSVTNDSMLLKPSDPVVPAALRSLSPRYISAHTHLITLEFHGGFDHYGYRVRHSDTDARLWSIYYYTEQGQRLLTTITND